MFLELLTLGAVVQAGVSLAAATGKVDIKKTVNVLGHTVTYEANEDNPIRVGIDDEVSAN